MKSFKVLVCDDEQYFRDPLVERLKVRKIEAFGVDSGEAALEFLTENPVDVIILDVIMKGLDGIQTLKRIKARYPLIEVILLTGHASVEAGMDYLIKPVKLDELMEKMIEAFDRKLIRQTEELRGSQG
ncbi:MAG: response regulator [Deltaproteobacteria bacterium]|nr:response regulator [Deltaproteobacteria bacterium]